MNVRQWAAIGAPVLVALVAVVLVATTGMSVTTWVVIGLAVVTVVLSVVRYRLVRAASSRSVQ